MRLTLEAAIINGDATFVSRAFQRVSKRLPPCCLPDPSITKAAR